MTVSHLESENLTLKYYTIKQNEAWNVGQGNMSVMKCCPILSQMIQDINLHKCTQ